MRAVGALLRKDLRLELRSPESVPAMALFSLGTFVLFAVLGKADVGLQPGETTLSASRTVTWSLV